jgi:hypothetical protein
MNERKRARFEKKTTKQHCSIVVIVVVIKEKDKEIFSSL